MNIITVAGETTINPVINVFVDLCAGSSLHQCYGACYRRAESKVSAEALCSVKKMTDKQCRILKSHVETEDLHPKYIYLAKCAIERIGGVGAYSLLSRYVLDKLRACRDDAERFELLCLVPNLTKGKGRFIEYANPREKRLLCMLKNKCDSKSEFINILCIAVMYMDRGYCNRVVHANRHLFVGAHREARAIDGFVKRMFAKRCESLSKVATVVNMGELSNLLLPESVLLRISRIVRQRWTSEIIYECSEHGLCKIGVRLVRERIDVGSKIKQCVKRARKQVISLVSDSGTECNIVPSVSTHNILSINRFTNHKTYINDAEFTKNTTSTSIVLEDHCNNSCETTDGLLMMDAILQSPHGGSVDENMTLTVFLDRMGDLCCENVDDNMQIDTEVSACNIVGSSAGGDGFRNNSQIGVANAGVFDTNAIIDGECALLSGISKNIVAVSNDDTNNRSGTKRKIAAPFVAKSKRKKTISANGEYAIAYANLLRNIETIALSFTDSEAKLVICTLKQRSLSIKDLFVVTCIIHKHLKCHERIILAKRYLQSVVSSCDTDREKEELLKWIPDSLKISVRVGEVLHGYESAFLKKFYEGKLPIQKLYRVVNTLSLYLSNVVLKKVLLKYEIHMSVCDSQKLVNIVDSAIIQRKDSLCIVEEHIKCINWKEKLLCSQIDVLSINPSTSDTIPSDNTKLIKCVELADCINSRVVSRKISDAKCNFKRKKNKKEQIISTKEDIRLRLFNGSLSKEELVESRKKLLIAGECPARVSRWFRFYKKKILMSDKLSKECKDAIIREIERSHEESKYLCKSNDRIPYEISSLINNVKSAEVQLCDLQTIRSTLLAHIDSDHVYRLFNVSKRKFLKKSPEKIKEIQLAFDKSLVKRMPRKDVSLEEKQLLSSFNSGNIHPSAIADSITKLFKLRNKKSAVSIICKYIVAAIKNGVPGDDILANLPVDVRHYGNIIRAFSQTDYEDILLLKNKTLPFDRLEEVSYIAVRYFDSSKSLSMLLNCLYSDKNLSIKKKESFFNLLRTLVCHGIVEVPFGIKNKVSNAIRLEDTCDNVYENTDGLSMMDAILQSPHGSSFDDNMTVTVFLDRMRDLCCENVDDNMQIDTTVSVCNIGRTQVDGYSIVGSVYDEDGFGLDNAESTSHLECDGIDLCSLINASDLEYGFDKNAVIVGENSLLGDISRNNNDKCLLDPVDILEMRNVDLSNENLHDDVFSCV